MIRGIDNQMMIQQTLNASRIAGEKASEPEVRKEFQVQLEREILTHEQNSVSKTEKVEHRRVERDKEEEPGRDDFIDQESRLLRKKKGGKLTEEEERKERLLAGGVGFEIDINA